MIKVLKYLPTAIMLIDAVEGIVKGIQGSKIEVRPSLNGVKLRVTVERI